MIGKIGSSNLVSKAVARVSRGIEGDEILSDPFVAIGEEGPLHGVGGGVEGEHIERVGVGVIDVGGVSALG